MTQTERFRRFVDMFANFNSLQNDLSLLDKPAEPLPARGEFAKRHSRDFSEIDE